MSPDDGAVVYSGTAKELAADGGRASDSHVNARASQRLRNVTQLTVART
jgi:hypothetical protein